MRERVQARVAGGHVAVVGVWDPVSEDLAEFFRATVSAARRRGLSVLAVTLDPDPVAMLRGTRAHPSFQDVEYRLWYQAQCGVHSRIVVRLTRGEVEEAGAALLLDGIRRHVVVRELLLKPGQSLGRGARGGVSAIRDYCTQAGIRVGVTDLYRAPAGVNDARGHLAKGELARAVKLLSQCLYWARPSSGTLVLPWPPGAYTALPVQTPLPARTNRRAPVEVRLVHGIGGSRVRWPAEAPPWLAFASGPADSRGPGTAGAGVREAGHGGQRH